MALLQTITTDSTSDAPTGAQIDKVEIAETIEDISPCPMFQETEIVTEPEPSLNDGDIVKFFTISNHISASKPPYQLLIGKVLRSKVTIEGKVYLVETPQQTMHVMISFHGRKDGDIIVPERYRNGELSKFFAIKSYTFGNPPLRKPRSVAIRKLWGHIEPTMVKKIPRVSF